MRLSLSHTCPLSYSVGSIYVYTNTSNRLRLPLSILPPSPMRFFKSRTISALSRSLAVCLSLVSLVRYTERYNCKFLSSLYLRFLTVTLRCPPFSVSSFSSCIRFLLISLVCTEIEFPTGRRWRGSARRRKNVGCAHSCDHGTS